MRLRIAYLVNILIHGEPPLTGTMTNRQKSDCETWWDSNFPPSRVVADSRDSPNQLRNRYDIITTLDRR